MKIAKVLIENFRRIERLELDFTDSLDRVRPLTVLVGANGCGKTSVLDAIGVALSPTLELPGVRPSLSDDITPRRLVRRGAAFARVTCSLRFSADEITLTKELLARLDDPRWSARQVPDAAAIDVEWTFPDPQNAFRIGRVRCTPSNGWLLLKGRVSAARLLRTAPGVDWLRRVGQVATIDQQRSISRVVSGEVLNIMRGGGTADDPARTGRSSDPFTVLLDLALKHALPRTPGTEDLFARIIERYDEICAPRRLLGAANFEGDFDLRFHDGVSEYGFDDLASGEAMILLLLLKLAGDRIHRSVVLVDEVELHQHPVWQRRIVDALPKMGDDNQFIVTTHSDYLLSSLGPASVLNVGAPHVMELAPLREADDAT